jgi:hypothetical protein
VSPTANGLQVDEDTRIQVLDNISLLPRADKEQRGAFIRDERTLVVWSDSFDDIVPVFEEFEEKLTELVWRKRPRYEADAEGSYVASTLAYDAGTAVGTSLDDKEAAEFAAKEEAPDPRLVRADKRKANKWWNWKVADGEEKPKPANDIEGGAVIRPTRLYAAGYCGFAVALAICGCLMPRH